MNSYWLDIVTPTLNSGKFIEQCILSTAVLRQDGATHLIVDSGSQDSTLDIARKHGITTLYCPPGNMYRAINLGFKQGKADWCTYINSDDMLYPDSIVGALEKFGNNADIIYGNIDYIDNEGRFLHHWKSAQPNVIDGLFTGRIMPFAQQGTLFRRKVLEKLSGFNEEYYYSADFDFFLRSFLNGLRFCYYDSQPIAAFRLHGDQFSQKVNKKMIEEGLHSLQLASFKLPKIKTLFCRIRFLQRNLGSYLVRILRYHHLSNKWGAPSTYSFPLQKREK
jgi:glycosyltransferase involved in cell wall biosynthesis